MEWTPTDSAAPFTASLAALRRGADSSSDWLDVDTLTASAGEIALEASVRDWPAVVVNGREAAAADQIVALHAVAPALRIVATVDDLAVAARLLRAGAGRVVPAGRWDLLLHAVRAELLHDDERRELDQERAELEARRRFHEGLLEESTELLVVLDEHGCISWTSPAAASALGLADGECFNDRLHPDDRVATTGRFTSLATATLEYRLRGIGDDWRTIRARITDRRADGIVDGVVLAQHDVTDEADAAAVLRHQATHDSLTDLPTRSLLMELLRRAIERMRRDPRKVAVLFIDLDGFKAVNDGLGHEAGDELLVAVADRLRATVRSTDVLARLGGDEFVVVLDALHDEDDAVHVAHKLVENVGRPFSLSAGEAEIGASVGIAFAGGPEHDPAHVLADADAAMYHVKAAGKGSVQLFGDLLRSVADDRDDLEHRLTTALERGEIGCLHAPIVGLASGSARGFTSWLRWAHPDRGDLAASEWLVLAEEVDLATEIDRRLLADAFALHDEWRRAGHRGPNVWLPLTHRQLVRTSFTTLAEDAASREDLASRPVGFRISEESVAKQPVEAGELMGRLAELGYRFALDRFRGVGTGPDLLQELPIDTVFLDGHFAQRLGSGSRAARAMMGIVSMSRHVGLDVVATDVDTHTHLAFVLQLMCPSATGALFAHPQSPERTSSMLRPDYRWNLPGAGGATQGLGTDTDELPGGSIAGLGSPAVPASETSS